MQGVFFSRLAETLLGLLLLKHLELSLDRPSHPQRRRRMRLHHSKRKRRGDGNSDRPRRKRPTHSGDPVERTQRIAEGGELLLHLEDVAGPAIGGLVMCRSAAKTGSFRSLSPALDSYGPLILCQDCDERVPHTPPTLAQALEYLAQIDLTDPSSGEGYLRRCVTPVATPARARAMPESVRARAPPILCLPVHGFGEDC